MKFEIYEAAWDEDHEEESQYEGMPNLEWTASVIGWGIRVINGDSTIQEVEGFYTKEEALFELLKLHGIEVTVVPAQEYKEEE